MLDMFFKKFKNFCAQKYSILFYLSIILFSFASCGEKNRYDIDVTHIDVKIDLLRFEKELFSLPQENFNQNVLKLQEKYPDIFDFYVERILMVGNARHTDKVASSLQLFVNDPYMRSLFDDSMKKFADASKVKDEIENSFRYVKHYYPNETLPKVFTLLTAMSYSVVSFEDDLLGLSVDMFLGDDYKFYPSVGYHQYQIRRLRQEYILPHFLKTYFSMKFEEEAYTDKTLLSEMIYEGKRLFFIDVMAPKLQDSLKIEYTKENLFWAKDNEGYIWNHFVKEDLLYTTDHVKKDKIMRDGPFTNYPGIPQESAPRLGEWVGWQIVKNYMKNNPDVTPQELFAETDHNKIFKGSRYRPRL
jgi:gliding motility-associated lipoprotein GldB